MSILDRAVSSVAGLLGGGTRPVQVGERASDFTLTDSDGRPVRLADVLRDGPALLAFYPRAFTGGCTQEMRTYTRRHADLEVHGARLLAISTDDVPTLARFKASLAAPFTFLSDPDGAVSQRYAGVTHGAAARTTVVVGPDGIIKRVTAGLPAIFPEGDIAACAVGPR